MARFLRYMLRALLVVVLLVDLKSFKALFFPNEDRLAPTAMDWLLTVLTTVLLLGVPVFIVWLDIRIGRRKTFSAP